MGIIKGIENCMKKLEEKRRQRDGGSKNLTRRESALPRRVQMRRQANA